MRRAIKKLNVRRPEILDNDGNIFFENADMAVKKLDEFSQCKDPVTFDYETSTVSPFVEDADILTVSLSSHPDKGYCFPLHPDMCREWDEDDFDRVHAAFKRFLKSSVKKVIRNFNFEQLWTWKFFKTTICNFVHDTMVVAHVVDSNQSAGLDFSAFKMTGQIYSGMVDKKHMRDNNPEIVANYNCFDSRFQIMEYTRQNRILNAWDDVSQYNSLAHRAIPVLAKMSYRGIRIDRKQLDVFDVETAEESNRLLSELRAVPTVCKWQSKTGKKFDPNNINHRKDFLFGFLKCKVHKKTKTDDPAVDKEVIAEMIQWEQDPDTLIVLRKIQRTTKLATFSKAIKNYKGLIDSSGKIHPIFYLHIARSYRSSARDPNVQNIFKHDDDLMVFRKIIIPRKGRVLLEVDYAGCEVRVICMSSDDAKLLQEIVDKIDTHRKWSARLYQKDPKIITKKERFESKNNFVFASFYGSEPEPIAKNMGLNEDHVTHVQDDFWDDYCDVKVWQNRMIAFHQKYGYTPGVSGIRRWGPLDVNKILNTPIQGPAFHLLLDGLVRIDDEMVRRKMESFPISEVHDSILFDAVISEIPDIYELVTRILTSKRFVWQKDVPLEVEWERGPNWFEMSEVIL
jgi:DNA polymerase I-like protein with 3'-5' exonuclease and polymerase domains